MQAQSPEPQPQRTGASILSAVCLAPWQEHGYKAKSSILGFWKCSFYGSLLNTQHLIAVNEHPDSKTRATPPRQGPLQCGIKVDILPMADSRVRNLDRWVYWIPPIYKTFSLPGSSCHDFCSLNSLENRNELQSFVFRESRTEVRA